MADAEVTSINDVPCFSISRKEERRNGQPFLGALSVSDMTVKPTTEIWGFLMTGGKKIPLSSANCILYGRIPASAEAAPAPELQTGRVYEVFLNGRSIPIHAKSCLLYGVAPATAEVKPPKAPPLKTGRMYDVFLNGRPADPSDPTRGYVGKFCLISGISGERKILRIDSDSQAWIDEICPVRK
ncbi:hypothetical protein ACQ4W4_06845 [Janthinobacterium sp. ZB1P44]